MIGDAGLGVVHRSARSGISSRSNPTMNPMLVGALKSGSMRLADVTDGRVRGIEAATRRDQRQVDVHLVGLREMIAVGVDPRILDPAGRRARVRVADVSADRRQLSSVTAEAGAEEGLAVSVQRVGHADARRDVLPREGRLVTGEIDSGHEARERRVRLVRCASAWPDCWS